MESIALYLAARHPNTPWYARVLAGLVAAYAFSPIDLIPDFVPVLGYLDDLLIVPAGIALCIRLIPPSVMEECRDRAKSQDRPVSRAMTVVILVGWALFALWLATVFYRLGVERR